MKPQTILRVFPRQTTATPVDSLVRFGAPDMLDPPEVDAVHVSVAFTWDLGKGHELHRQWSEVHPSVEIGGPALGDSGGAFVPGRYVKEGNTITSRGCPMRCAHCFVPKREGALRELPIRDGWNILDNNLLACSPKHFEAVCSMLSRQEKRPVFTGGLEAALVTPEIAERLREVRTNRMYLAYDRPAQLDGLSRALEILMDAGFTRSHLYAYVLIGQPGDTQDAAERRLRQTWEAGAMPYAMLYRDDVGEFDEGWRRFQRLWVRPAIIRSRMKDTP